MHSLHDEARDAAQKVAQAQLDTSLGFMFKTLAPMIEEKVERNMQKFFSGLI